MQVFNSAITRKHF